MTFLSTPFCPPSVSPLPSVHHPFHHSLLFTIPFSTPFCSPSFSPLPSVHHLTAYHLSTPFCSPSHRQPSLHSLLFTISTRTVSPFPSVHHLTTILLSTPFCSPSYRHFALHSLLFTISPSTFSPPPSVHHLTVNLLSTPFCSSSFSPLPSIHLPFCSPFPSVHHLTAILFSIPFCSPSYRQPSLHSLLFSILLSTPFCSPSHHHFALHSLLFAISPPTISLLPSVHHLTTNHISTPFCSPTFSPPPSIHHLTAILLSNPFLLRPHGRAVVVTSETYRLTAKEAYCEHPLEGAICIERTPHSFGERLVQWQTALICVRDNGLCEGQWAMRADGPACRGTSHASHIEHKDSFCTPSKLQTRIVEINTTSCYRAHAVTVSNWILTCQPHRLGSGPVV